MCLVLVGHVRFDQSAATGRSRAAMQIGYSLTHMHSYDSGSSRMVRKGRERADAGSMTSKKCHFDIQLGQWSMMSMTGNLGNLGNLINMTHRDPNTWICLDDV